MHRYISSVISLIYDRCIDTTIFKYESNKYCYTLFMLRYVSKEFLYLKLPLIIFLVNAVLMLFSMVFTRGIHLILVPLIPTLIGANILLKSRFNTNTDIYLLSLFIYGHQLFLGWAILLCLTFFMYPMIVVLDVFSDLCFIEQSYLILNILNIFFISFISARFLAKIKRPITLPKNIYFKTLPLAYTLFGLFFCFYYIFVFVLGTLVFYK